MGICGCQMCSKCVKGQKHHNESGISSFLKLVCSCKPRQGFRKWMFLYKTGYIDRYIENSVLRLVKRTHVLILLLSGRRRAEETTWFGESSPPLDIIMLCFLTLPVYSPFCARRDYNFSVSIPSSLSFPGCRLILLCSSIMWYLLLCVCLCVS